MKLPRVTPETVSESHRKMLELQQRVGSGNLYLHTIEKIREENPEIHQQIERVIDKLLEKVNPLLRFSSLENELRAAVYGAVTVNYFCLEAQLEKETDGRTKQIEPETVRMPL